MIDSTHGHLLLHLAACGESDGLTWAELEHLVELRIEEAMWRATSLISGVLDKLAEANK